MAGNQHTPRPKFDTLFQDPRHYRADCRLMGTAIRRGWLDGAPQADRDALLARFEQAIGERDAAWFVSDTQQCRAIFAQARAMIAAVAVDQRDERRDWCAMIAGVEHWSSGRPRERWHVGDYPTRLDANELRQRFIAEGVDLQTLQAIHVASGDLLDPACEGERIALAVAPDARYGWRLWLLCPGCGCRRVHLFPIRSGFRCRKCARIGY